MSRDGELTSHLPLMKAPTPVMLLLGEPWSAVMIQEEFLGLLASRIFRTIAGVGFSGRKFAREREDTRLRATAPERCPHVGLDSEGAQRG
jgi:hypothetical protein